MIEGDTARVMVDWSARAPRDGVGYSHDDELLLERRQGKWRVIEVLNEVLT